MYAGNVSNWGMIDNAREWLYLANPHDNYTLYRLKADGTSKEKLNDEDTRCIQVVEDWVYYVKYDRFDEHVNGREICKIRCDGTNRIVLRDGEVEISSMYVYKNRIFYWSSSWTDLNNELNTMDMNGQDNIILSKDRAGCINVMDGWVYYLSDGGLYRIKTDGTHRTILDKDECEGLIVVDGWIYYCNFSRGRNLYKIRIDGTDKTRIVGDDVLTFNVDKDIIYYSNFSDDGKLYRIDADGNNKVKVCDDRRSFIYIIEDWIYYYSSGEFYKIKPDGEGREAFLDSCKQQETRHKRLV